MESEAVDRPVVPADGAHGTMYPSVVAVVFEPGPQRVLARLRGEIDMEDVAGLKADLTQALRASRTGLDVDLSAVTFCDSSGLHVLLELHHLARATGKELVLNAVSHPVAALLRITEADHVLEVRTPPADPPRRPRD
ncbi:STAS domain-containing protein [Streptomyces sp. NPDC089919]|uniref:STAS domain-containing protein n=1 Tax=Streptomyces sp. NPDC089919 TaxID=3155188 RepID=UPI00343010F8